MKGIQLSVTIDEKTYSLVTDICKIRGEHITDFFRKAVKAELASLGYLNDDEKKALGVS